MPLNDKIETKAFCINNDQVGINIRHWVITAVTGATPLLEDIVDKLSKEVGLLYRAWLPDTCAYLGMTAQVMNTIPPADGPASSHTSNGGGDNAGQPLPSQAAGLIHLKAARSGRHGRGRIYIPFGNETFNGNTGNVTGAGLSVLDTLRLFYSSTQSVTVGPNTCVLSPAIRNRVTNDYTLIIDAVVDDRWATQRRRGQFGRQNPVPVL